MLDRALTDQRGSMLVVGIPMGLLLTAVTYHLIGVCDAALLAELLRFSADKTAFESAIWHSRGMNVVAMLNVLMTSLSAVWASWNVLQNSIGFVGTMCKAPVPTECNGHTEAEAQAIWHQMDSHQNDVKTWLGNQGKAIADLQQVTSSVTPSIALNQTVRNGSGPTGDWLQYAVSISTSLIPDDNIDAVTGQSVKANYPRLGVATSLPALPLEAAPATAYCKNNVIDLVPDVSEALATRLGGHWTLDTLTTIKYDWKANFKLSANSMSCLGFAPNNHAAGIWFPAKYSSQQYHEYAFAVWGFAFGKNTRATAIDNGVKVAAGTAAAFTPPDVFTASQAEFYYDCGGQAWSKCQDSALLSPGWTARLRRVRKPSAPMKGLFNALAIPASFTSGLPTNVQNVVSSPDALWNRSQDLIH